MWAFQNMFFSIWNVEINKSSNFAHVTRLPSKHIHDTEKEYSRSFACNVLHAHHVFIPQYLYDLAGWVKDDWSLPKPLLQTTKMCMQAWKVYVQLVPKKQDLSDLLGKVYFIFNSNGTHLCLMSIASHIIHHLSYLGSLIRDLVWPFCRIKNSTEWLLVNLPKMQFCRIILIVNDQSVEWIILEFCGSFCRIAFESAEWIFWQMQQHLPKSTQWHMSRTLVFYIRC